MLIKTSASVIVCAYLIAQFDYVQTEAYILYKRN